MTSDTLPPAVQAQIGDILAAGMAATKRPFRVVCCHCDIELSEGREPASHGVCEDCKPIHYLEHAH